MPCGIRAAGGGRGTDDRAPAKCHSGRRSVLNLSFARFANARRFRESLAGATRRQSTSMGRPIAMARCVAGRPEISSDKRRAGLAHPHRTKAFLARCRSGRCSCEHLPRGRAKSNRDLHAKTPGRCGDRPLRDQHHVARVVARHAVGLHPGDDVAGLARRRASRLVASRQPCTPDRGTNAA